MDNGHYQFDKFEAEDVIEALFKHSEYFLSSVQHWCVGNALKYLLRLGRKGFIEEDLYKAEDYLHRARTGKWIGEDVDGDDS